MKKIAVLILTIVFIYVCIPPLEVNAANNGSWKVNSKGWWYEYEDGSYAKNEFVTINGKTYFFNKYGYMITGWKKFTHEEDPNILPSSSYWCYFNSDGSMAKSEFIQGYYLEESGHWRENEGKYTWVKHYYDENTYDWHYVSKRDIDSFSDDQANGRPFGCTGWTKIDKKYYYFDDFQGNMLSNCYVGNMVDGFYWLNKNGQWSYKGRLYKIPSDYVLSYDFYGDFKDTMGWVPKNVTYRFYDNSFRQGHGLAFVKIRFDFRGRVSWYLYEYYEVNRIDGINVLYPY